MGSLSINLVVMFAVCSSTNGHGFSVPGFKVPCQPFKPNQTELCSELQSLLQVDGAANFCNISNASCQSNVSHLMVDRKDHLWARCYCDPLCEEIGDCCVDYGNRHNYRPADHKPSYSSCRIAPSDTVDELFGFIMVASCPSTWEGTETAQACKSTNFTADPLTALPVVDMATNVTYANSYCVKCHNTSNDLHLWSLWMSNMKITHRKLTLQDIKLPDTLWDVVPVGNASPDKCVPTPPEAKTAPDTKNKKLCRSYANGIGVKNDKLSRKREGRFKNPHCALTLKQNLSDKLVQCAFLMKRRLPPFLRSSIFVFSVRGKEPKKFNRKTVWVNSSCKVDEVYDPFKGKCLLVQHGENHNVTITRKKCRGPLFLASEFFILDNNSIFILPHQKIYNNESYLLSNQTLILCSNFSRYYTKTVSTLANKKSPPNRTLYIITYIGFSLSIIALLFLMVTYFLFAELRTYPGKMVMHLSCAMIAMQSVYFAADPDVVSSVVCAVMGALYHFFILAVFLWMSAIAHNTQKTFTALNVDTRNILVTADRMKAYIRYCGFSWGVPFVVVGICVTLQLTKTGNVGYGFPDHGCQLSIPARTYAVAIPVSLLLLFNIIALIRTAFAIKQQGNMAAINHRNLPVIVLKLTTIMGITWTLGFVLAFYPTPYLAYPFVILNSFQGVLTCLSFAFKKHVITMYKQRFTNSICSKPTRNEDEQQTDCTKVRH